MIELTNNEKQLEHAPKLCIFLTGGAYAPYATCMATPRAAAVDVVYRRPIGAVVTVQRVRRRLQMARLDSTRLVVAEK